MHSKQLKLCLQAQQYRYQELPPDSGAHKLRERTDQRKTPSGRSHIQAGSKQDQGWWGRGRRGVLHREVMVGKAIQPENISSPWITEGHSRTTAKGSSGEAMRMDLRGSQGLKQTSLMQGEQKTLLLLHLSLLERCVYGDHRTTFRSKSSTSVSPLRSNSGSQTERQVPLPMELSSCWCQKTLLTREAMGTNLKNFGGQLKKVDVEKPMKESQ